MGFLSLGNSKEWAQIVKISEGEINYVAESIDILFEMYKKDSPNLTQEIIERVGRDISYQENSVFILRYLNKVAQDEGTVMASIGRASERHLENALAHLLSKVEKFTIVALERVPNWPEISVRISKETKMQVAKDYKLSGE
jgi:hypothetical protein